MSRSTSGPPSSARLPIFVLCWLCLLADGYDLLTYGATLPSLIGRAPFFLTEARGGQIGAIALVGMLVGSLVAGTLTDILGRRRIFITSVVIFSAGMLLAAAAPTVELFVLFRVLTTLGVGGLLPTAIALASEFAAPQRRSRTLGLVLTGTPIGFVLAALVASQVVPLAGFRPVYAAAGLMLALVPVLIKVLPESPGYLMARGSADRAADIRRRYGLPAVPADRVVVRTPLTAIVRDGNLVPTLLIWGTTFFSLLTVFGITTWLPQMMARSGYGLGSAITFLTVYGIGSVVGTALASSLADRIGPKPLVIIGYLCAAGALLAIAQRPPTALLVVLVLIAGFGGLGPRTCSTISSPASTRPRPGPAAWAGRSGWDGSVPSSAPSSVRS